MGEIFKKIKKLFLGSILLFAIFGILPTAAQAATLYFSPSSGTHAVNTTFTVNVYVSSVDQAMNAASGVISFPADKLAVDSLSKSGSIFSLWVQEPSFSNSAGTVNFEGIVLNPGFTGSSGKAISITFKTKAAGNASLAFSDASALANDGAGTNILSSFGNASCNVNALTAGPQAPESTTPTEIIGAPSAPRIFSPTHSDPEKWYSNSNPKFTWLVPSGVTAVRVLYDKFPNSKPQVMYSPAISEKQLENIKDGTWYFHAQFRNANGWGEISHFRFQIDTEKPSRFEISEVDREDLTDPAVKFVFDASDKISGIDHYEIQIGNENAEIWQDDGSHIYETPVLGPGKYTLIAKAVDRAGNSLANSADFTIQALEAPIITDYPKELQSGETLTIKGTTKYSDAQVTLWLQHDKDEPKTYSVKSDQDGKFTFVADSGLSSGVYTAWAEVIDARGAKSDSSEKITISVGQPTFIKIGSQAVGFLAVIIPLVVLVFALLFIIWYGWHKFSSFRKKLGRIKKEVREAESALHKAFDLLKDDIRDQIKLLEKTRTKRQLTEEEERIIKQLKKDLDDAEKFVRKEIQDIEKVMK